MIVAPDITGRKFICLGKTEFYAKGWRKDYIIGEFYYEAKNPQFEESNILQEKGLLYLYDTFGNYKYVDEVEFEEVDRDGINFRLLIANTVWCLN